MFSPAIGFPCQISIDTQLAVARSRARGGARVQRPRRRDCPNQIRGFLGDHHHRGVRISAHDAWKYRSVDDSQPFDALYSQLFVYDGIRIRPHATRAARMVHGRGGVTNEVLQCRVIGNCSTRFTSCAR